MRPRHPVFFFDRCCGKRIPDGLRLVFPEGCVIAYYEVYGEEVVSDDVWLALCAQNGWVAITRDRSFNRSRVTAAVIHQYGLAWFEIGGNLTTERCVDAITIASKGMVRAAKKRQRPFRSVIRQDGKLGYRTLPHP